MSPGHPLQKQFGFINKEHYPLNTMKYCFKTSPIVLYLLVAREPPANAFQLSVTDLPKFILGHGGHSTA